MYLSSLSFVSFFEFTLFTFFCFVSSAILHLPVCCVFFIHYLRFIYLFIFSLFFALLLHINFFDAALFTSSYIYIFFHVYLALFNFTGYIFAAFLFISLLVGCLMSVLLLIFPHLVCITFFPLLFFFLVVPIHTF